MSEGSNYLLISCPEWRVYVEHDTDERERVNYYHEQPAAGYEDSVTKVVLSDAEVAVIQDSGARENDYVGFGIFYPSSRCIMVANGYLIGVRGILKNLGLPRED